MNGTVYRVAEAKNDITILDKHVSERPSGVINSDVRQTFTVKYKKPFKGSNMLDVSLQPLKEYNLTSYYGCYQDSVNGSYGTNSSAPYKNDTTLN